MSYTVLARKYRSLTLDEIIGQEPIVTTLKNAILGGRVHHGYLFSGTRGVGKTSMARILAKSLNCLKFSAPTVTPCCTCESCTAINRGDDIDVIEIDAASNTGVDNIRDLRSNANYRPVRSRHKIYIIDEVHMLSTGAFNALLKTLEEPPDHVKFIFATTELQKVPATIQSRVQLFEFQSIPVLQIVGQLKQILQKEGIQADDVVLRRVARYANGSMRDALSLLDQLLSFGTTVLDESLVSAMLPSSHDERLANLIDAFSAHEAAQSLKWTDDCLSHGWTPERFCENLIEYLRILMLIHLCGPKTDLVDVPTQVQDRVVSQSAAFDAPTFVYMINVLEELRRQVKNSGAGRALVDAAVVRLSMVQNFTSIATLLNDLEPSRPSTSPHPPMPPQKPTPPASSVRSAPSYNRPTNSESSYAPKARPTASRTSEPPVKSPPPRETRTATREELTAVQKDPLVRQALDLFNGTLVNVERPMNAPTITPSKPEPEISTAPEGED